MNKTLQQKLNKILNDKTSGSSDLLTALNKLLLENVNNGKAVKFIIDNAEDKLKHFAVIANYINDIKKLIKKDDTIALMNYLRKLTGDDNLKYRIIFNKIYNKLKTANKIITLSNSRTILKVLQLWHQKNKRLKVIVPESRPANEGRLMAKELLKKGISVELITDAMMGMYVPEVDAAIVGADVVLKNGNVINKSGSKPLAVLCKYHKKPFYVLAAKSKFINRTNFKLKEEPASRIWDYKHPKLKIKNFPFEEIEKKLITSIITD